MMMDLTTLILPNLSVELAVALAWPSVRNSRLGTLAMGMEMVMVMALMMAVL